MSDWEISASTEAQFLTFVRSLLSNENDNLTSIAGPQGFSVEGSLNNGTRFSIAYYKTKRVPTGNTDASPFPGKTVPELSTASGVYAIMRWRSPSNTNPPQPSAGSGVTLVPLPPSSPSQFTG